MKKIYNIYQYLAFLLFYPLSIFIWLNILAFDYGKVALISGLPVLVAYIIPALGTNVTGLWEFNTKYRLGKFRWYHGFVLGASINIFGGAMYYLSPQYNGIVDVFLFSNILAAFIAFWNWFYDIYAIKSNFLIVYNKPHYEGKSAEEIAIDYAPVYFYMFGLVYGVYIKILQFYFSGEHHCFWIVVCVMHIIALSLPTAVYALFSYLKHGNTGLSKYKPK